MGLGFPKSQTIEQTYLDLLFKTELHDVKYLGPKRQLLKLVKDWGSRGIVIPLYYQPMMHLIIVRLDHTVTIENRKKIFMEIKELNYNFEIVMRIGELIEADF